MELTVGQIVEGKITGITNFGVFVDLGDGKSGMVHISEVAQTYVSEIREHVKENDVVKMKVLAISDEGKISLSIKRAAEPPKKERNFERRTQPKPDNSFIWGTKQSEPASFEEMMNKFKVTSEEKFNETLDFTKKLLNLRNGIGVGLVFKGLMMLDWNIFIYQSGPYVMGENDALISEHDKKVRANAWRMFSADWMKYGEYVTKLLKFISENKKGEVNMCLAGTFDGGIYLPYALCAQMYRTLDDSFVDTLHKVSRRACITVD